MQQGDRLLGASSCELPAVYGDLGGEVGKQLARASLNLLERNVDRARDVRLDVRGLRQDVDDCERRIVQAAEELFARNFGDAEESEAAVTSEAMISERY